MPLASVRAFGESSVIVALDGVNGMDRLSQEREDLLPRIRRAPSEDEYSHCKIGHHAPNPDQNLGNGIELRRFHGMGSIQLV
jgi:hypothetical protein